MTKDVFFAIIGDDFQTLSELKDKLAHRFSSIAVPVTEQPQSCPATKYLGSWPKYHLQFAFKAGVSPDQKAACTIFTMEKACSEHLLSKGKNGGTANTAGFYEVD